MKTLNVTYLGTKAPRTFPLPMPFVSLASKTGAVTFEATGSVHPVEADQARAMCAAFPELFELTVEKQEKVEKKSPMKSGD